MVRDPARESARSARPWAPPGSPCPRCARAAPTLENAFVSILRDLEGDAPIPDFPRDRDQARPDGGVAIGARALGKSFGGFEAVKGVDLEVRYGEVYGLLGANGAGKTTTIKMLCGLIEPSAGDVSLAGERGRLRSEGVRQQVGYMSQKFSLYDDLSVEENLDFFAGVYGVPRDRSAARKRWVLDFAGLAGRGSQLTGSLPGGWKQRVAFGAAIMHEPRVLFLDEPTSGVDPIARRAFWALINRLADEGTAILVTTHYLEEAEQCNRLGFMVAGAARGRGNADRREGRPGRARAGDPHRSPPARPRGCSRPRRSPGACRSSAIASTSSSRATRRRRRAGSRARLEREGIRVLEAREQDYSLEDVFLAIVEKSRRAEDRAAA